MRDGINFSFKTKTKYIYSLQLFNKHTIFYSFKTRKTNDLCEFIDLKSIKNNHYTSKTCIKHSLCAYLREILC